MRFKDVNEIVQPTRQKTTVVRNLFPETAMPASRKPGDVVLFQDNPPDTRTQPEWVDPGRLFNTLDTNADVIDVRQILNGSGIQRPDVRPAPQMPQGDPSKPDIVIKKKPKQNYTAAERKELGLD